MCTEQEVRSEALFHLFFPCCLGGVLAFSRTGVDEIGTMMGGEARPKKVRYCWSYMSILFLLMMDFEAESRRRLMTGWIDGIGKKGCDEGLFLFFSCIEKRVICCSSSSSGTSVVSTIDDRPALSIVCLNIAPTLHFACMLISTGSYTGGSNSTAWFCFCGVRLLG